MRQEFKYDVALSFAEEDIHIAERINDSIKRYKDIVCYYYPEHVAFNWGRNGLEVTLEAYRDGARYVLQIISKHYAQSPWSELERMAAHSAPNRDEPHVLKLLVEDEVIAVAAYKSDPFFVVWKNNPGEIAEILNMRVQLSKKIKPAAPQKTMTNNLKAPIALNQLYDELKNEIEKGKSDTDIIQNALKLYPLNKTYLQNALKEIRINI